MFGNSEATRRDLAESEIASRRGATPFSHRLPPFSHSPLEMLRARAGAARGLAVGARRALSTAAAPISSLRVPIYQLDSFASQTFRGNPAAVCPLDAWLPDETLMAIADENALSETAFFVRDGSGYHLRWFTPTLEVAMCGHGTLATAALILERMEPEAPEVAFSTLSGELIVRRSAEDASLLSLDFPQWPASAAVKPPSDLIAAIGAAPTACYPIPPCPVTKRWTRSKSSRSAHPGAERAA